MDFDFYGGPSLHFASTLKKKPLSKATHPSLQVSFSEKLPSEKVTGGFIHKGL